MDSNPNIGFESIKITSKIQLLEKPTIAVVWSRKFCTGNLKPYTGDPFDDGKQSNLGSGSVKSVSKASYKNPHKKANRDLTEN